MSQAIQMCCRFISELVVYLCLMNCCCSQALTLIRCSCLSDRLQRTKATACGGGGGGGGGGVVVEWTG